MGQPRRGRQYDEIQFAKTDGVLRGMRLGGLGKTAAAQREISARACHRPSPAKGRGSGYGGGLRVEFSGPAAAGCAGGG